MSENWEQFCILCMKPRKTHIHTKWSSKKLATEKKSTILRKQKAVPWNNPFNITSLSGMLSLFISTCLVILFTRMVAPKITFTSASNKQACHENSLAYASDRMDGNITKVVIHSLKWVNQVALWAFYEKTICQILDAKWERSWIVIQVVNLMEKWKNIYN